MSGNRHQQMESLWSEKRTLRRNDQELWFREGRLSPGAALVILGTFAVVVALFGGTSRTDQLHHALLRPAAALFLMPAIYYMGRQSWREAPVLLALLGGLVVWMGLQLVPLPHSLWQGLPDRTEIAQLDSLMDLSDLWRPVSLAPTRGLSALFGLIVPIAALLLALSLRCTSNVILHVLLAIGLMNAALGFMQLAAGPSSPLYLYAYAPAGGSFGLFANRNHGGMFSVLTLLIVVRLMGEGYVANSPRMAWAKIVYPLAFFVLLLSVLVTGSRAAFIALFAALVASSLQVFVLAGAGLRNSDVRTDRSSKSLRWFGVVLGVSALALITLFVGFERVPALDRMMAQDPIADLRWKALPILLDMAGSHWLWGSGFGSFDVLYQSYEPTELLMVAYFNQAHNDWVQIVIEGGLPACLLLAGLVIWIAVAITRLKGSADPRAANLQIIFWTATVLIVSAASLVDYPLRTPIFQVVGVWLLASLALDQHRAVRSE